MHTSACLPCLLSPFFFVYLVFRLCVCAGAGVVWTRTACIPKKKKKKRKKEKTTLSELSPSRRPHRQSLFRKINTQARLIVPPHSLRSIIILRPTTPPLPSRIFLQPPPGKKALHPHRALSTARLPDIPFHHNFSFKK
ncbi:uncharacterized protein K452DRAFT_23111 [Aplosporella prunicola CBS 121167]|uniref:Uncharacterized protein n=1 Tax=Aplosporella prunicola CBS 121167 TaxID=1176127 RepID=A0A6A6ATV4_9PEZI|nr:uncharacterized protein K452DRAFT_23111 [Aplosporella prunicola CBS 121167]KAF2135399.1 hypothetical protein K452DRAFT_23111 [Aplosporella prunicola CBS 121167]